MARAIDLLPRIAAGLASVAILGAVLYPLKTDKDGFPLSNYPMFSSLRPDARVKLFHVVGRGKDTARPMSPEMLGTDEIMQAFQTAKLAVKGGPAESKRLCKAVALRVAADESLADIERLEVRVDWFDAVEYWKGNRRSDRGRIVAKCRVVRSGG